MPRDAAAVILLKDDKVLWAQRNPKISFLGGWHAFPGGKVDRADYETKVKNCADKDLEVFIVAAVRELFEETGVLPVRNGEKLTRGQRSSLHDDLISGRSSFAEILADWNLWIDGKDFFYTGFWTTPQFSPVRFKTRFFLAVCPSRQEPYAAISELQNVEFILPEKALNRWANSEVLISPPVLISLQELADSRFKIQDSKNTSAILNVESLTLNLLEQSRKLDGNINFIELNPRVIVIPLKTETLPPATHTNCFIVGRKKFVVIDAAARDASEQRKLFELVDSLIEKGFVCREIIVSHLHPDHFGGETALKNHLELKFGLKIPISAHVITAESLRGKLEIEKYIEDEEKIELNDENGEISINRTSRGLTRSRHLCFTMRKSFLLSIDNVSAREQ